MRKYVTILFFIVTNIMFGQTFTYSGYIYNAGGGAAPNVPVKLYKRTTPNLVGFTSQTNYNGHSYYRSTGSATWTSAKTTCESMNGHLATVSNTAENNFLFNTWPSGWIGYYQDKVAGYTYSEPAGGYRWTEAQVTDGLSADYDVSSYSSGTVLTDIKSSINATLYNTPTYSSTGGKYLAFNGSNQYAITNNLASKFSNTSISVVTWIYPTNNGVIASELGIASASSGWHESIIEITGSNTLRVGLWSGTGIVQLSTSITLNTWNLVCITYNGTTMKGYLNNVNFGSTNFTRQAAFLSGGTGQQHFAFGLQDATNMGHGGYGSFRLGDFQFFNRAITADEIDRTYNLYAYRYKTNQYTNWNPGEPNNSGTEDYTQFVSGGKWNDLANTSLPYVIEFDYVVGFTPWVLHQTVYTNSSGYYSFSQSTNPSTEWYIQIDIPTTVTTISNNDAISANNKVISRTFNSLDYYRYDVNNDGIITISDVYYIYMKKSSRFSTWGGSLPNTRLFTQSQYNIINSSTSDLRSTYPGTSSITISTPTSGGSSSYYLINTGYSNSSILSY
jgi:hypothetical protein